MVETRSLHNGDTVNITKAWLARSSWKIWEACFCMAEAHGGCVIKSYLPTDNLALVIAVIVATTNY